MSTMYWTARHTRLNGQTARNAVPFAMQWTACKGVEVDRVIAFYRQHVDVVGPRPPLDLWSSRGRPPSPALGLLK